MHPRFTFPAISPIMLQTSVFKPDGKLLTGSFTDTGDSFCKHKRNVSSLKASLYEPSHALLHLFT